MRNAREITNAGGRCESKSVAEQDPGCDRRKGWTNVLESRRQPRGRMSQSAFASRGERRLANHLPIRRGETRADHGRMRRGRSCPIAEARPHGCHEIADGIADAHSLKVRQTDRAMLAPRGRAFAEERQPRRKRHGLIAPRCEKAHGTGCELAAQIVMRCEQAPRRCLATNEIELNDGPSPKPPPCEAILRGAIGPIGVEPIFHRGLSFFSPVPYFSSGRSFPHLQEGL